MNELPGNPLGGIYIHVPFCERKCPYCDFYSIPDLTLKTAFLEALSAEIFASDPMSFAFDTLYIGGGTPSILEPTEVGAIIDDVFSKFCFEQPIEVTLEANPGTVDFTKLRGFRSAGVNRLNIGVQSFHPRNLKTLGRIHTGEQAHAALASARRAGFEEIGLDLIYGLPGQTRREWSADLGNALAHAPEHIACYMLTVEPATPLAEDRRAGRFADVSEKQAAGLFVATSEWLTGRGYLHYEISNFARRETAGPAYTSRHNSKYWTHAPYLGFGPAAHSFLPPKRFWNQRDVAGYAAAVKRAGRVFSGEETLTQDQEMLEAILLGLRTAAGVDLPGFRNRFGVDFMQTRREAAEELQSDGLIRLEAERCAPTLRGMLFVNTVAARLV